MFRSASTHLILGILALGGFVVGTGCKDSDSEYSKKDHALKLNVKPSASHCVVGETITFFSRTENTLGRDAKLEWTTTGGQLKTEEENRIARVTFDTPGTYTVTGVLSADGHEVDRSATTVTVAPLP